MKKKIIIENAVNIIVERYFYLCRRGFSGEALKTHTLLLKNSDDFNLDKKVSESETVRNFNLPKCSQYSIKLLISSKFLSFLYEENSS